MVEDVFDQVKYVIRSRMAEVEKLKGTLQDPGIRVWDGLEENRCSPDSDFG